MRNVILTLLTIVLSGCSSEKYDCHIITKNHTFVETKLCDGFCSPKFKITDIVERISEKHVIVKSRELENFVKLQYDTSDMVNKMHQDFVKQTGYEPTKIIKLDCKKI